MKRLEEHYEELLDAPPEDDRLCWQYPARFERDVALSLVKLCIDQETHPAAAIRAILIEHFTNKREGVAASLTPYHNQLLDQFCELTKKSREQVVADLIEKHLLDEIVKLRSLAGPGGK